MNLQAPVKVQKLQQALHAKAKESPEFRFYALYDKIYREDILAHAYRLVRGNRGKPGIDGEDFPDIEAYGLERWLGELAIDVISQQSDLNKCHSISKCRISDGILDWGKPVIRILATFGVAETE